jgi:hypothetical protein
MNYVYSFILVLIGIGVSGCVDSSMDSGARIDGEWLIPTGQVFDGGPGKDGIPSIDNPKFISVDEVPAYLRDDDLVVGIRIGNEVRAYPHPILDWHEIVNDGIDGTAFSVTYCPLTGSALTWNRNISDGNTTFGVSGLLYNSNLIAYDRQTDSYWSQMMMQAVNGQRIRKKAELITMVETQWGTWRAMYPDSEILSTNTGFSRQYGFYPYGDYKISNRLIFPVVNSDDRLHRKERVHGTILGNETRVFQIAEFPDTIHTINDSYQEHHLVTIGSRAFNFAVAFERTLDDGTLLHFTPVQNQLPIVMKDTEGTLWDIFGFAVEGPRTGAQLRQPESYIAYWFAWAAFFPGAEIHIPY